MPRRALFYTVMATVPFLVACAPVSQRSIGTVRVSAQQAVDIANQKLASSQMDAREPTLVEFYNTPDNACLTHEILDPANQARVQDLRRALVNHRYYLVMYQPQKSAMFASTICVFVDEAGDVLTAALL